MTNWTFNTKNSSSYSNVSKNTSTYTNQGKTSYETYLLLENGDYMLLETGDRIILDQSVTSYVPTYAYVTKN